MLPPTISGGGIMSSGCPLFVSQHLFRVPRYPFTYWRHFNETRHKYSS